MDSNNNLEVNSDIINDIINVTDFYNDEQLDENNIDNDTIIKLNEDMTSNLILEINDNNNYNDSQYEWKPEMDILNINLDTEKPKKNYIIADSESEAEAESEYESENSNNSSNSYNLSDLKFQAYKIPPPINFEHVKKGVHISLNNENILKSYKMLKKDLDDDLIMFNELISNQTYYKITLFKRVLNSYLKICKNNDDSEFHPKIVYSIKHMGHTLNLYNSISALLSELLFTKNINKENEIDKYINYIIPFLDTPQLQENLLNQILILIDNYNKLFDEKEIINIFHFILNKKIINNNVLYSWYHKLDDDNFELHNKLNIKYDIPKAVYIFLENMITAIFENYENEQYQDCHFSI